MEYGIFEWLSDIGNKNINNVLFQGVKVTDWNKESCSSEVQ